MYIYITRHGETYWNVEGKTQGVQDTPLSERGIHQAEILAPRLLREGITQIYSSDLDRAYQTAAIIGQTIGRVPVKRKELREISFGKWEGLTLNEIESKFPGQLDTWRTDHEFSPEDGESVLAVQSRISTFIDMLSSIGYENDERILVVSHAITSKMLIIELLEMPIKYLWSFRLDNTGISIINISAKKKTIFCLNDTCHLVNI